MCLILFLCRNSISKLLNKIIKTIYIYYFLKTIIKSTLVEL
jgi:hypothetical protein